MKSECVEQKEHHVLDRCFTNRFGCCQSNNALVYDARNMYGDSVVFDKRLVIVSEVTC